MAVNGNKIKQLRKQAGLTQEELGKKMGVVKQTVSSWENNISEPNSEILSNIASIFNVSVDYLLGRENCLEQRLNEWKLGEKLKSLRELNQKSQQEVCSALNIEQSDLENYESNKRIPKINIFIKLAKYYRVSVDYLFGREDTEGHGLNDGNIDEYGLDGPGITDMLGYPDNEEDAVRFSHKLALQIDFSGSRLIDVANSIGVSIETILEWLFGKKNDYHNYYEKLSNYFDVEPSYWTRPGAISPGIEPTTQEYLLILKYRFQNQYDDFKNENMPIENFFPNCHELSASEWKWLNAFRQLDEDNQDIIIGKTKEFLKEQRHESVAADDEPKMTGTDSPK